MDDSCVGARILRITFCSLTVSCISYYRCVTRLVNVVSACISSYFWIHCLYSHESITCQEIVIVFIMKYLFCLLFILEHVKASAVKKVIVPPCYLAETLPNITMNRHELLEKKMFYLIFLQNFVKNIFFAQHIKYKVNPGVQATKNLIKRC